MKHFWKKYFLTNVCPVKGQDKQCRIVTLLGAFLSLFGTLNFILLFDWPLFQLVHFADAQFVQFYCFFVTHVDFAWKLFLYLWLYLILQDRVCLLLEASFLIVFYCYYLLPAARSCWLSIMFNNRAPNYWIVQINSLIQKIKQIEIFRNVYISIKNHKSYSFLHSILNNIDIWKLCFWVLWSLMFSSHFNIHSLVPAVGGVLLPYLSTWKGFL